MIFFEEIAIIFIVVILTAFSFFIIRREYQKIKEKNAILYLTDGIYDNYGSIVYESKIAKKTWSQTWTDYHDKYLNSVSLPHETKEKIVDQWKDAMAEKDKYDPLSPEPEKSETFIPSVHVTEVTNKEKVKTKKEKTAQEKKDKNDKFANMPVKPIDIEA